MNRKRGIGPFFTIAFIFMCIVMVLLCVVCYFEYKLLPIVSDAAVSRARTLASEMINDAVARSMAECGPLVEIAQGSDGISGVVTHTEELTKLRSAAVSTLVSDLSENSYVSFSVPAGSLTGSNLLAGKGFPVNIRLVPIGDITADIRTEFVESGINQTLHKIVMRVRVTLNVITARDRVKLELANDIVLAETVIVGKVPDAYTAINRFEIDEDEENDLNDYAATLP